MWSPSFKAKLAELTKLTCSKMNTDSEWEDISSWETDSETEYEFEQEVKKRKTCSKSQLKAKIQDESHGFLIKHFDELENFTVMELKEILKDFGCTTTGIKAVLVARVRSALKEKYDLKGCEKSVSPNPPAKRIKREKTVQCSKCSKKYVDLKGLSKHMETHAPYPYFEKKLIEMKKYHGFQSEQMRTCQDAAVFHGGEEKYKLFGEKFYEFLIEYQAKEILEMWTLGKSKSGNPDFLKMCTASIRDRFIQKNDKIERLLISIKDIEYFLNRLEEENKISRKGDKIYIWENFLWEQSGSYQNYFAF